jgi:phosphatidylinositol alpha-1,6-mannosyltransferase
MKSLLISKIYFPPQVGGISQYMVSVAKALGPEEICCLTGLRAKSYGTNNDNAVERELQARVYRRPYAFSPATVIQGPALAATLMEIMVRERPQVVQLASVFEGYLGLHLNRWLKLPYVVYAHGNEILQIAEQKWEKPRLCLQRASRVLANSYFTAELVSRWGAAPERNIVLHPGCDTERFRPRETGSELRQRVLGHHCGKKVILTIGNLVERKGHDMVIKALPKVLRVVPDAIYLIVGDGACRPKLEDLASEMGVRDHVVLAGYLSDHHLPEIYALGDVFVMPSRARIENCDVEGFGLVFLEASACGKPVIAGRSGGIPDAVDHGVTGYLVDPGDPDEIAEYLIRILQDPTLAGRLGESGRKRVLREFTWDHFASKLRQILSSVVDEQSSRTANL